jgi:hypothetical protein
MTRTQRYALILFLLIFAFYNFPIAYDLLHKPFFNWAPAQDIASTSLVPISMLERGDLYLDQFTDFIAQNYADPYFVAHISGRVVSRYPVAAAVVSIPFYGIPLATGWLAHPGYSWLVYPWSAFFVAKFASALLSALAAVIFFFCARELSDLKTGAALTVIFALATSVWSTNSQGLWQQTPSVLFQVIGIWFLLRGSRLGAASVAPGAFFFSAATVARTNDGIAALVFSLFVMLRYRAAIWRWILWSLPPALFFFTYNAIYNGSPFVFGYQDGIAQYLRSPQPEAIAGLVISPSRGLLIYSPFLIFAPIGIWVARRDSNRQFYLFCAIASLLGVLLLSMWEDWGGGWGYGTRMMTDLVPYLMLLLIPVFRQMQPVWRTAFFVMAGYAIIIHSFALWDYGERWHWHWENYRYDVWDWRDNEPLFYVKEFASMARQYLAAFLK